MEGMKQYPDNYFDLCIVDPPYGIGADKANNSNKGKFGYNEYHTTDWDNSKPTKEYFNELYRVSKNQIIWGANYFTEFLKNKMCWIVWDKKQDNFSFSDGELAYTSYDTKLKFFRCSRSFATSSEGGRIHPTQKPVKLYEWLLFNYSSPEHKILDTHLGSASHAIAWHYFQKGGEFVGFELDEEYFDKSIKRIEQETAQISLF
jgi:site-specific DNA-methyltransferase (adenine-specific)